MKISTFSVINNTQGKLPFILEDLKLKRDDTNPDLIVLSTFADLPSTLVSRTAAVDISAINSLYYQLGCSILSARLTKKPILVIGGAFHLYHVLLGGKVKQGNKLESYKLKGIEEPYTKLKLSTVRKYFVEGTIAECYYEDVLVSEGNRTELVIDCEQRMMGLNFHPEIYNEAIPFFKDYFEEFLDGL